METTVVRRIRTLVCYTLGDQAFYNQFNLHLSTLKNSDLVDIWALQIDDAKIFSLGHSKLQVMPYLVFHSPLTPLHGRPIDLAVALHV